MEEVHEIAKLHYETAEEEVKTLAVDFFNAMDIDGDGKVDIHELRSIFPDSSQKFFNLIDSDGSGALSFDEVKTLFYIEFTGRRSCDNCSNFIAGTYFCCPAECCSNFDLCFNCFRDSRLRYHIHDGRRVHLLDNFAYLHILRTTPSPPDTQIVTSSRSAIVHQKTRKRDMALAALVTGVRAYGFVHGCPIM